MATELHNAALNVSRTKLLTRLKSTLKERQDERTEKRAKARVQAQEQIDRFVAELTTYVANAPSSELRYLADDYENRANSLRDRNEETTFSGGQDDSLERAIRALEMSEDKTVEVKPTDDLYRLL